jgi:uncharacterized membrane protein
MTRWTIGSLILVAAAWAGWGWIATQPDFFPDPTPIHWGISFEPDGWTTPSRALATLTLAPGVMTAMLVLTLFLPRLVPSAFAGPDRRRKADYVMFLVTIFFGVLFVVIAHAMHTTRFSARWLMAAFFVMIMLVGPAMRGVKRNGVMGVRTPWTLADDRVWEETHRFAARFWVGIGVVGLVLLALGVHPLVPFALLLVGALYPVLHSYLIARRIRRETKVGRLS